MRRVCGVWLVAILALAMNGCAYKAIKLHEVRTVESEQGRKAVLSGEFYLAFREVIERSPNVKSVTRMTDLKGEKEPSFFVISSDGEWLIYQAMEKAGMAQYLNLWKISTRGGSAVTRLTAGRYLDMEPAWDRTASAVYFASNRTSQLPKLWRVRADGAGGITRITQGDSEDRWPEVIPTGDIVYYASRPVNAFDWQIWRIGSHGSLPTQLKEGLWPKLSPDGAQILYCACDSQTGKHKVWIMDIDGTSPTQLTSDTKSDDMYPTWSADGRKIVFASDAAKDSNGKRNFDIWMMDVDGANLTQLTTNGSTDLMPRFSPDGRYIYFLSNRGFFWDIWRMEIADMAR